MQSVIYNQGIIQDIECDMHYILYNVLYNICTIYFILLIHNNKRILNIMITNNYN